MHRPFPRWLPVLLSSLALLVARAAAADTPSCLSLTACRQVCEAARDPVDCFNIGLRYQKGLAGLPQNEAMSAFFYRRACDRNVAAGCTNYGFYMYWGRAGLTTDKARGAALYAKGCNGGDSVGCNNLASAYAWGQGVPADLDAAIRLFRKACDAGVQLACKNAKDTEIRRAAMPRPPEVAPRPAEPPPGEGVIREKDPTPPQPVVRAMPPRPVAGPAVAADHHGRGCVAGAPAACFELALMYLHSWGLPAKPAHAAALLGQACDAGHGEACARLAWMLADGKGVPRDVPRSIELLQRGCAARSGRACRSLGALYRWGDSRQGGIAQKDAALGDRLTAQALAHYRRDCDAAEPRACTGYGNMIWYGEGTARDPESGRAMLQRACDGGDLEGCERLGGIYSGGERGTALDRPRGVSLYRRACDGGLAVGCARLASAYRGGAGIEKNLYRARELLTRACPKDPYACWDLGKAWEVGPDGSRDDARAEGAYREGCEGGDAQCCGALKRMKIETSSAALALKACDAGAAPQCLAYADMLKNGRGTAQDASSALGFYLRACEGGIGSGCVGLGTLLRNGASGVTADAAGATEAFKKAVPIFTKECNGKKPESCAELAELYCDGTMLPKDSRKVVQLLERGCGRKHWGTCNRLGARLLRGGCGVHVSPAKAVATLGKACEAGDEMACEVLVYGYQEGYHLKKDQAQALKWIQKACDKGLGRFCQRLGYAHEWGDYGLTKDPSKALPFYKRACDQGVSYGCSKQKALTERLRTAPP
ncbi:MAG: SEL1-like repeat protein [Deltaproteobacteria bacterium]|nr:SEL1-like repeat protein [Deltaproteobacteria bacterium]